MDRQLLQALIGYLGAFQFQCLELPKAAQITADWCKRHGVVHHSVPYLYALADAAKYMARAYERESVDPLEVRAGLVGNSQLAA